MTSKVQESFLTNQATKLSKYQLTYVSVNLHLTLTKEKKFKKKPTQLPQYKNKKLITAFNPSKNSMIIPLGKKYDGLIGVDVDNKNDTVNFFNALAKENKFDLKTFTVKTINGGFHYYFKLTEKQQELLKNFMSSTAKCFSTQEIPRNIDIKYTNQFFFGSSYLVYKKQILTYEICNDTPPVNIPNYLFDEILRIHQNQTTDIKLVEKQHDEQCCRTIDEIKINHITNPEKENRLKLYLECLKVERFDDRDNWMTIGAIIFNEGGSFELFEQYSKKSIKYDHKGCYDMWNSFKEDRKKKATIKKLLELAELDADHDTFIKTIIRDKLTLLTILFENGPSDLYIAYLFYNLNQSKFMYDQLNKSWYSINKYGIYIQDKEGDSLKLQMNMCLISTIKQEYLRLFNQTDDKDSQKDLFGKYQKLVKYCSSSVNKENLLKELKLLYYVDKIYEKMDNVDPYLIGFDNGVYDLKTHKFRNALPEEFISVTTGYYYKKADPKLKKEAMAIIESIFPEKEESNCLLVQLSLALLGCNPEEKFYIWIGDGSNGKGLLRDIIQIVLGGYYDSMDISYFYKTNVIRSDAPNPVMARKKNSRMVITTEPEVDQKLKSSIIKTFTGNDPIQVRNLFSSSFNYVPKFKLIIQTNNEPDFIGFDKGMKRRPVMIRFPNKFVENPKLPNERKIDKTLKEKIVIKKMYIHEFFEILVDHFMLYQKEGLKLPKRFSESTEKFIDKNDPVGMWIKTNINKTNNQKDIIKASELYDKFLEYADNNDVTQTMFKNILAESKIIQRRKASGNYYIGIKLKNNTDEVI